MIFQVANKYPPGGGKVAKKTTNALKLIESMIRKNWPEIRGLSRLFYGLTLRTEIFRCRSASKGNGAGNVIKVAESKTLANFQPYTDQR